MQIKPGAGITVFIIFFGIAMLESFKEHNTLMSIFWVVMAVLFLLLDVKKKNA